MKIYLAGPDVFEPNSIEVGESLKAIAKRHGHIGLYPMDNLIPEGCANPSKAIFEANLAMIHEADAVIANLRDFRGLEPDSGTVWEVGYAIGLGKPVIGYVPTRSTLKERVLASEGRQEGSIDKDGLSIEDFGSQLNLMLVHSMTALVVGTFEDAIKVLNVESVS